MPSPGEGVQTTTDDRVIAGRYRLERRIGGGAMGVVYLARDEVLDRTVAVKELLLPPNLTEAEAELARKRSFREARLAARLQHRHAITVFNVVEDDGKPVLVMEYLPSQSLAEVLTARGSLSPEETARVGAGAASALAAAHDAGIVHRDVKPGNILIGENGTAKITDFGISRAADDGTITGSGSFAGTPAFLSPEAARGEPPSQASDVFSLGATLYTAVEGRFPYGDSENQMAVLYAAAAGRYTPPTQTGPLTDVLSRMMRLDPAERPTMAQVARELAKVAMPQDEPGNRRRLVLAGLAVLVVVAAGVTALVVLLPGKDERTAAPGPATAPATPTTITVTVPPPPPNTAPPATASLVDAVREYYSIVPGNLDLGWSRLSPAFQARIGRDYYVRFWSAISDLSIVAGPTQAGDNTVEVTIDFLDSGARHRESHTLGMIVSNGQALINSDSAVR